MKYRYYNIIGCVFLIMSILFMSCEKEIELEIEEEEQQVVVDGWIQQGSNAMVYLTRTAPYFGKLDSAEMVELVIRYAKITLSDGANTEVLTLKRDFNLFPPYYYKSTEIIGQEDKTYHLKIELSGKTYTATTTIPKKVDIDSIYFKLSKDYKGKGFLYINFKDPIEHNYYRVYAKRLGVDNEFIPVYFPTIKDIAFNGKEISYELIRGAASNTQIEQDLFFNSGDSVMIRLASIDQAHYNFWKYADSRMYTSSNPFAVSTNDVVTNVNNAIGLWGGYAVSDHLFVVP